MKECDEQCNGPTSGPAATRDWSLLDGWEWAKLLSAQPQFAVHCDWSKLGRADWRKLLSVRPEFREMFLPECK